jgi:hypothetical protein
VDAFAEATVSYVPIADIAARLNASIEGGGVPMTNKWVGSVVRRLGIPTVKTGGTYAIHTTERGRINALAERLCVQRNPTVSNWTPDNRASNSHVFTGDTNAESMEEQSSANH